MSRNNKTARRCILLAAMLILVNVCAFAASSAVPKNGEHYATYAEYQAAGYSAPTWKAKADVIESVLEHAKALYAEGDAAKAYFWVSNAGYFGYYETTGFERNTMGFISGARVSAVELQFKTARQAAKKGKPVEDFNAEVDKLIDMIKTDGRLLDGDKGEEPAVSGPGSPSAAGSSSSSAAVTTFSACFSIILREGFEAILIVGAIIAYLTKSAWDDIEEAKRKCRPVYIGAAVGIIASFLLAWLLYAIKLANTASQEIIEGVTALIAVCVLYYVSNWMLSKSESDAWVRYIKSKAEKAGSSGRGGYYALAFTAFLAVFREGAEVVLFYQPLLSDGNAGSVWAGFIFGVICLVFIYLGIRFLSIKIPIRPFFTVTSIIMFLMSISFLGGGIKELIEGDLLSYTSPSWLQWIPSTELLDVLGIYPCLETLIPQILLLSASVVIFVIQTRKNNAIHAEADKKRLAEKALADAKEKAARESELKALVRSVVLEVLKEKDGASLKK